MTQTTASSKQSRHRPDALHKNPRGPQRIALSAKERRAYVAHVEAQCRAWEDAESGRLQVQYGRGDF